MQVLHESHKVIRWFFIFEHMPEARREKKVSIPTPSNEKHL